jgi:mRNA interferase YafQ
MKYKIASTGRFRKDLKTAIKRNYDIDLLNTIVEQLANCKQLSAKHKDHPLTGSWDGHRECHITPDWLLIYKIEKNILILTLTRTGTHSDLF